MTSVLSFLRKWNGWYRFCAIARDLDGLIPCAMGFWLTRG